MRIVFFGSPDAAVPPLQALVAAGHEIVLVVTNPPRRRSRRAGPSPTPVAAEATDLGIEVTHDPDAVAGLDADLGVVVAFGHIIGSHLLAELPMVNLHFSLLPRWRGAAPVQRAILAGDERTGVCVMEVAEGLDTGGIFDCVELELTGTSTASEVTAELAELGAGLLVEVLAEPLGSPVPQSEKGVTYAEKITTDDLRLDWELEASMLQRVVLVGGAWTTIDGRRLKVLESAVEDAVSTGPGPPGTIVGATVVCGTGSLRLLRVQPEGRSAMEAAAFFNGARLAPGTVAGS